jgi:hypothetical protein
VGILLVVCPWSDARRLVVVVVAFVLWSCPCARRAMRISRRSMPSRASITCISGLAERIRSIQACSNGTPVRT